MKCLNIRDVGWSRWGAVYIGRQKNFHLHFGNPFTIGIDGDREEVCHKHLLWMLGSNYKWVAPERRAWIWKKLYTLKGKDLLCFCAPKQCHGDNYIWIINQGLTLEDCR